jgi:hypothetical protein
MRLKSGQGSTVKIANFVWVFVQEHNEILGGVNRKIEGCYADIFGREDPGA